MKKLMLTLIIALAVFTLTQCRKDKDPVIDDNSVVVEPDVPIDTTNVEPDVPEGVLNGCFTVGMDDTIPRKVWFSKGNLQYIGSATTPYWKFADNQYDCFGITTNQNSADSLVDRDLFCWGTSGYNNIVNDPYSINFYPWATSKSVVNNSFNKYGYGPSVNMNDVNLTGTSVQYDWGFYNTISNGGNEEGIWRTLTRDEWDNLRYRRYDSIYHLVGMGTLTTDIDGNQLNMFGCFIMPDEYESNFLSQFDWSMTYEDLTAAEGVFLPAAGSRSGTDVLSFGIGGYYWSTSNHNLEHAYSLSFDTRLVCLYTRRYNGYSVRLVMNR